MLRNEKFGIESKLALGKPNNKRIRRIKKHKTKQKGKTSLKQLEKQSQKSAIDPPNPSKNYLPESK